MKFFFKPLNNRSIWSYWVRHQLSSLKVSIPQDPSQACIFQEELNIFSNQTDEFIMIWHRERWLGNWRKKLLETFLLWRLESFGFVLYVLYFMNLHPSTVTSHYHNWNNMQSNWNFFIFLIIFLEITNSSIELVW